MNIVVTNIHIIIYIFLERSSVESINEGREERSGVRRMKNKERLETDGVTRGRVI